MTIKSIITEWGGTPYAAAKKTGVPLSTVYDWFNGRRNAKRWTVEWFKKELLKPAAE